MPFNFTGQKGASYTAKQGVVMDGETITVGSDGYTVTSTLSSYTAFASPPVRASAGVWSITLKDSAVVVMDVDIKNVSSGGYLSTQLRPTTVVSGNGALILNWVFNSSGTPTDLPASGSFRIFVVYSETHI